MKNLQEVLQFIKNADRSELEAIKTTYDIRRSEIVHDVKSSLKIGDNVSINHKKINRSRMFFITKINGVNVKVSEVNGNGIFNVHPSLLVKV